MSFRTSAAAAVLAIVVLAPENPASAQPVVPSRPRSNSFGNLFGPSSPATPNFGNGGQAFNPGGQAGPLGGQQSVYGNIPLSAYGIQPGYGTTGFVPTFNNYSHYYGNSYGHWYPGGITNGRGILNSSGGGYGGGRGSYGGGRMSGMGALGTGAITAGVTVGGLRR